jgi:hypothetical protein
MTGGFEAVAIALSVLMHVTWNLIARHQPRDAEPLWWVLLGVWAAEGKSLTADGTGGALMRYGRKLPSVRTAADAAAARVAAGVAA